VVTKRRVTVGLLIFALTAVLASLYSRGIADNGPLTYAEVCAKEEKELADLPGTEALTRALESRRTSEDVYAVIWVDVHLLQEPGCPGSTEADPQSLAIDKYMLVDAIDKGGPAVLSKTIYRPVASELAALVHISGTKDTAWARFDRLMKEVDGDLAKTGIGGNGPLSDTSVSGYLFVGGHGYGHWR